MLKTLAKSLLGRLLGYGVFGLGFWLLFQGFLRPNLPLGFLGGGMILGGMYLIAAARRSTPTLPVMDAASDKEDNPADPLDRSDESDKLPS